MNSLNKLKLVAALDEVGWKSEWGESWKMKFTGKKTEEKIYYKHTGHPGGIKQITPARLIKKNKTEDILRLAVKRMLPGGPLAKKQLTKLRIYNGEKHPHDIQKPKELKFSEFNKKNTIKE